MNAVPKQWKEWIRTGQARIEKPDTDENDMSKLLGNITGNNQTAVPCAVGFWLRKYNYCVDKDTWSIAHRTTKETRLRELHWKILHNIYPTNILLCKMKVKDSNKCSYCNDTDYLEHFFHECYVAKDLWSYVEEDLLRLTGKRIRLSVTDVLFGVKNIDNVSRQFVGLLNHLILIGKMVISKLKKTESQTPVRYIYDSEKLIRRVDAM